MSSFSTCGGASNSTCKARHKATRTAVLSGATLFFSGMAFRLLRDAALGPSILQLQLPIGELCRHRAERPAAPGEAKGFEQAIAVVAIGDRRRDQAAGRRGGVEPMAAEGGAVPQAFIQLPDLRHVVAGIGHQ